jgi:hypothetical protein
MNIYTYYENVGHKLQDELLQIWKQSWEKYGFNAIVFSREEAKQSILFQKYYDFIQRVHEKVSGKILQDKSYCMAAQLEIVAFHTILESSYVSDYDMINNGFHTGENLESLVTWRNDACSCFASGDKNGWEKYINFLFEKESTIIEWCKRKLLHTGRSEFHDQDFLEAIRDQGITEKIYNMYRRLDIAGADYVVDQPDACKIPHLSHRNMMMIQESCPQYKNYTVDEIRIILAKKILHDNN